MFSHFLSASLHHQQQRPTPQSSHSQHHLLEETPLAIMYFTKVSLTLNLPAPFCHIADISPQFLSVMAVAIMGTSAAAVAGQPKSDLDARACFCK